MSLINTEIKPFSATAFHNGEFVDVTDADLKGKWSVVFFYPADFTFVCPTELGDLADNYAEFQRLGVEIYSVSTDTHFTHKAWHDTSDTIGKIQYPMLGDPTGDDHAATSTCMREGQGLADRGTFVDRPRRRDPVRRDHRRGHRPQRRRAAPQGQGRAVRRAPTRARSARPSGKRATRPSPRRSTSSARSDPRRRGRHARPGRTGPAPPPLPDAPAIPAASPDLAAGLRSPMLDADARRAAARPTSRRSPARSSSSPRSTTARSRTELAELLDEIAALSDHITVGARRRRRPPPVVRHRRVGTDVAVRFAGIPLGHEFTSLVLALLQVGGHPSTASRRARRAGRGARGRLRLRDLLLAVLPELPRRGAGAQPDERAQPEHHATSRSTAPCSRTRSTPAR